VLEETGHVSAIAIDPEPGARGRDRGTEVHER
jgi:hypothetical protein